MRYLFRSVRIMVEQERHGSEWKFCSDYCPMRDRNRCRVDAAELTLDDNTEFYLRSTTCMKTFGGEKR